jgi:hypothetical protein
MMMEFAQPVDEIEQSDKVVIFGSENPSYSSVEIDCPRRARRRSG